MANFTVDFTVTIGDIINIIMLALTFIGLAFAAIELSEGKKINRASLVKELYLQLYDDDELRDIFYKIEWSNYSESERLQLQGTEEERKADKLLSFFEVVCDMYYRGILTKEDIAIFDYEMRRVYAHPAVQDYLSFLEEWQEKQSIGKSYVSFKKYCGG